MKLRKTTLIIIGLTLLGLMGVLYATTSTILLNSFARLEEREMRRNVQRVLGAYSNYLNQLNALNYEWAAWDETYLFIQDRNKSYIERNLRPANFLTLRTNLMLFINSSGEVVLGQNFDFQKREIQPLSEGVQKHLQANLNLLQQPEKLKRSTGLILLEEGPMAIAKSPILTSGGKGPPRGMLIMGRYLDDDEIKHLSELTHLNINLYQVNDPQLSDMTRAAIPILSQNSQETAILIQPLNENAIAGYALLWDIYQKPGLLLQVTSPRDIYKQGQVSLRYFMVSLLVVGFVFTLATLLLLEKLVLLRLERLSAGVKGIGMSGDVSMRVEKSGNDELSSLAGTINWMLESLESCLKALELEREKAESLLLNILPQPIAERLKKEERTIADSFTDTTVLFADIVGFTKLASRISPVDLVNLLNKIFSAFDQLAGKHGLEKIKTIGDAYMVVGGIPTPRRDHAEAVAEMALDMQKEMAQFSAEFQVDVSMRIGINSGSVVAGVIGLKKFIYDLWGDTVNIASRMESHGLPGCIQVSRSTYELLKDKYELQERGVIQVKGKGEMTTYLLIGRKRQIPKKDLGAEIQEF